MEETIKEVAKKFLELSKNKEIQIISHFDTDGISSATIMLQTLKRMDKIFSLKVLKNLEKGYIQKLSPEKLIIFLDIASGSLDEIASSKLKNIFIIDHHQIIQEIPKNVQIINPELNKNPEKKSSSYLTYLFCKEIHKNIKDLAKIGILGMIGDQLEEEIMNLQDGLLKDGEIKTKKGLLIYPSTRPLNRTLEYSSNPYIPEVTGNTKGVLELLRETGLKPENGKYKSLLELSEEEMEKLVTAIMLRKPSSKNKKIVGEIFLLKIFNKLEDAREISALINACSMLGHSEIAIQFLMEIPLAKKLANSIHVKYRQELISGIKVAQEMEEKINEKIILIDVKDKIKSTLLGTITNILSHSSKYLPGTILISMSQELENKKIKISGRNVGKKGRNIREILNKIIIELGEGEVEGHEFTAEALINSEKKEKFKEVLYKNLKIELVKV